MSNNVKINYPCGKELTELLIQPFNYNEEWHLGDVEKLNKIGEGGYGVVRKVKRKQCGKEYAIKKSEDNIVAAQLEITALKLLANKPNIINLCGFELTDNVKIILPLLTGSIDKIKINKNNLGRYFKQILLGVNAIHNCDIMHRDMKTPNIVYDQTNDEMFIIDFGLCVPFDSFKVTNDVDLAATISFRAPEALLDKPHVYDKKIDIWAVGCIFYFMIMNKYIVSQTYDKQVLLNEIFKLRGTPNERTWVGISNYLNLSRFYVYQSKDLSYLGQYANLIADCLTINPKNRPTATQLLSQYF